MRILEGVAREGTWACFSDVDSLPPSSLSVLSQMMQIISMALQAKKHVFTLSSRKVNTTVKIKLPSWDAMEHTQFFDIVGTLPLYHTVYSKVF